MGLNTKSVTKIASLCIVFAACLALFGGNQTANAATFTVTNTNDSGAGSLRQALINANSNIGNDTVTFNIASPEPHVISILTPFSGTDGSHLGTNFDNTNTVTIDGCSQPGSICNQFPLTLKVQVDASSITTTANTNTNGLFNPVGVGSTVKGLSITGGAARGYNAFGQYRVTYNGDFVANGGYTLKSNFIGLNLDGTANGNNAAIGAVSNGSKIFPMQIGGPNPGEGNVIGSNSSSGINTNSIFPATVPTIERYLIEGNYFGLDPTGTQARPNGATAINIVTAGRDTTTSGPNVIIRNNKIANSGVYGIQLYRSGGVLVENNEITNNGTAGIFTTGPAAIRSLQAGPPLIPAVLQTPIVIQNNAITGTTGGPGIEVGTGTTDASSRITIRQNSIYSNSGLGIDLANNGVTANDNLDPDTGPNTLQNFPTLIRTANGQVYGTYNGIPNQTFTIDFYTSSAADASGNGEGETWVTSAIVTTNADGNAVFGPIAATQGATSISATSASLNGSVNSWVAGSIPNGSFLSATATDSNGNTSEFSNTITTSSDMNLTSYSVGFRYRLNGSNDPWVMTGDQVLNFPGSYSAHIANLAPGMRYEYQLVVTTNDGEMFGNLQTFMTPDTLAETGADLYAYILAAGMLMITSFGIIFRRNIINVVRSM